MTGATRSRTSIFAALVGVLILAAACDGATGPDGALAVRVEQDALELTNTTGRHAYYFVVNTEALPLINWAQCVGESCSGIAAGERVSITLDAPLRDGGESGLLTLYWWHAVSGPDGPQPGPLRLRSVSLH